MYKSTTGLQTFKGCPIRLRELNTSEIRVLHLYKEAQYRMEMLLDDVARVSYNKAETTL